MNGTSVPIPSASTCIVRCCSEEASLSSTGIQCVYELQEKLEKAGILRDVVPKVLADVELTVSYGGEQSCC